MRNLRTEEEIIANWKGDLEKPVVSVCCITYNHEPYIEDALEGFLIQETDFPFEILIHDDASTDRTADIIREYEAKYPKLIKPIYQVENQYSKGALISPTFNYPRAKGQYIAVCEGDDYWTYKKKLQKQYDFMEFNPEYSACAHRIEMKFEGVESEERFFCEPLIDPEFNEFISVKRYIAMVSLFAKTSIMNNIPHWGKVLAGGHILSLHYLRMNGRIYYINDKSMAVHRKNPGGITFNPGLRYKPSKMARSLNFVRRDWFKINRLRITMYEGLFLEARDEYKPYIANQLSTAYMKASLKEFFNFNFSRAILYCFKLIVLRSNIKILNKNGEAL